MPQLVPFADALADAREHRGPLVQRDHGAHELHNEYRFAHPGPAEETGFAPAHKRAQQIDNLDARGQHLGLGARLPQRHRVHEDVAVPFNTKRGTAVERVATDWVAWELTHSALWVSVIAFCNLAPAVLISPIAGAVADRMDRVKLTMASQFVASAQAAILVALLLTGLIRVEIMAGLALCNGIAETFLRDYPETATTLGVDKDKRAALKHKLTDRSPEGQQAIAAHLRKGLADVGRLDMDGLSPIMRTNVDVVQASFANALQGFAFGYGDVATGSWRNTPYVVCQNVGAYLDVPRFLDSDHQVRSREDGESYLDRLESYAEQLDGETERLKIAGGKGVIAPDFALDKALKQIRQARGGTFGRSAGAGAGRGGSDTDSGGSFACGALSTPGFDLADLLKRFLFFFLFGAHTGGGYFNNFLCGALFFDALSRSIQLPVV